MGPIAELQIDNLALVRGGRMVQRGLKFQISRGTALAIGGRNGAGKTSLLRAIAGLLEPAAGGIVVRFSDGRACSTAEERAPLVGWIAHRDAVKPQLTPAEHLDFHRHYFRGSPDIEDALERSGLWAIRDVPAQYLSAGQQRRIAFARLIAATRPLWLLDEPFSALDKGGKSLVRTLISNHCASGGIVVAATHEPIGVEHRTVELA